MKITLAYGKKGLTITLPEDVPVEVVEGRYVPGLLQPEEHILQTLLHPVGTEPLPALLSGARKVAVVFSDITRATPYGVLLPPLLDLLRKSGTEVVFFNATGTHRPNNEEELVSILGKETVRNFRIVQNECENDILYTDVGTTSRGNPVGLLTEFLSCDVKILTGFIEPHFFAGFSGGGKAVMPGLAALPTIMRNHGYDNLSHPKARWGVTAGNPLWEDITEAAEKAGPLFLLNVTMNRDKEITGVFAGDLRQAHGLGVLQARDEAMAPVPRLYDLVITSNAGYPLDLNLYQTVKGISAAAQVVKPGGHILAAADCWDGIPDHGEFGKLLSSSDSPEELLERCLSADPPIRDAWQALILCRICEKAQIHLYSENLTDRQIESAFMTPVKDMAAHVGRLIRTTGTKDFALCVLPQGPLTIPFYR